MSKPDQEMDIVALNVAPSQQSAQGPVPKPGEPVVWTKGNFAEIVPPATKTKAPLVLPLASKESK